VVGIQDSTLLKCFQLDTDKKEAVYEHQGILKGDCRSNPISLDVVKADTTIPPKQNPDIDPLRTTGARLIQKQCSQYGRGPHK